MAESLFIFIAAMGMVILGAAASTRYAALLAESFSLSKYAVGFIVIAGISILPETFIGINSALEGIPAFGLATLFGSNVADLTLVFALIMLLAGRGIKIESKIRKNESVFPYLLLLPLLLGLDGFFSRAEGVVLLITGAAFYYIALNDGRNDAPVPGGGPRFKNLVFLLASMAALLAGAHFTVTSAVSIATHIGISPILIGMCVVGLGTTLPELFFSLQAVKKKDDSLAVGDILGTVLADATVVVGILAILQPFAFPQKIIYITGGFMVVASFILFHFMNIGRTLTRKEARFLIVYWLLFVLVEFFAA